MRKRNGIILAVIGIIVFFFCMEGWGADWRLYAEKTVVGDLFYDSDGITYEPNSIVRVWTKTILSDKGKLDLVANSGGRFKDTNNVIELVQLDCRGRRVDISQAFFYSIDGNVVQRHDYEKSGLVSWESIVPDSTNDLLLGRVCKQYNK